MRRWPPPQINKFPTGKITLGRTQPYIPLLADQTLGITDNMHAMVVGQSGSGKSRLLQHRFVKGLERGEAMGMIDPHHDLAYDTLTDLISKGYFQNDDAFENLIYLDFGNDSFVPFNILAGNKSNYASVALNALEGMKRCWPELEHAPLFARIFLSAVTVLIFNNLPITYLYRLLDSEEKDFRQRMLANVPVPLVHQAFHSYEKLGAKQVEAAASTLTRAFLLTFSPLSYLSLSQPECLDFRTIMDGGKSFIINLGNVSDFETRQLLGAWLLVLIEQAALSRTNQSPGQRVPTTVLVDEWASFSPPAKTISGILSQARKFNLRIWLACQSIAQIESAQLLGAMENCRLSIAFGLGRSSAEAQSKHVAQIDPYAIKEEGLTEHQHAQYLTVLEQFESVTQGLQNQDVSVFHMKIRNKPVVQAKTVNVPRAKVPHEEIQRVLDKYKATYQRSEDQVIREIRKTEERVGLALPPREGKAAESYIEYIDS